MIVSERNKPMAPCSGFTQEPPAFQLLEKVRPISKPSLSASLIVCAMACSDWSLKKAGPAGINLLGSTDAPISQISKPPIPFRFASSSSYVICDKLVLPLTHGHKALGLAETGGLRKFCSSDWAIQLMPKESR